jgi:hypothetical protein
MLKRSIIVVIGLAAAVGAAGSVLAGASSAGTDAPTIPDPRIGPEPPLDTGAGEDLLVVLGGVYATRDDAEAANAHMPFADMAGYYVVPVAQFQGFREEVGNPGDFALVSVFRTQAGAEEFVRLANGFGYAARLLPDRVRSLGGVYAGLGQEANPDGSGPLLHPIPESLP